MANTFNNTFNSSGGKQTIVQGDHAIGEQNYYAAPQGVSAEELLKLLAEIKARLTELPEEARDLVQHEVDGAQLYAKKEKPNAAMITAKLTAAQKVLAAIPGVVAAALPVVKLIDKALIWCGKAAGM